MRTKNPNRCAAEGCNDPFFALGLCKKHYWQYRSKHPTTKPKGVRGLQRDDSVVFNLRVTPAEQEAITKKAKRLGLSRNDFVRRVLLAFLVKDEISAKGGAL